MASQFSLASLGLKFLGAIAASVTFILCLFLAVQLFATLLVGDASFAASKNFWVNFGSSNFAKLIFGLSLASLAISVSTDRFISWVVTPPKSLWLRNALSYFAAFFTVLALSTASFFLANFPVVPITHIVALIVMILASLVSALVYAGVCGIRFNARDTASAITPG